jgi:hypothetical protein
MAHLLSFLLGFVLPAVRRDYAVRATPHHNDRLAALREVAHVTLGAALEELEGGTALRALGDERLVIRMTRDLDGRWCVTVRVVSDWGPERGD